MKIVVLMNPQYPSTPSFFSRNECHLGGNGPGMAFETLTLTTLGWWLFTTAAVYACTDREGTANSALTLPGPRENKSGCLMFSPESMHQA